MRVESFLKPHIGEPQRPGCGVGHSPTSKPTIMPPSFLGSFVIWYGLANSNGNVGPVPPLATRFAFTDSLTRVLSAVTPSPTPSCTRETFVLYVTPSTTAGSPSQAQGTAAAPATSQAAAAAARTAIPLAHPQVQRGAQVRDSRA